MEDEITYEDIKYQKFNEDLDVNGLIDIAGYKFYPSYLLYNVDNGVTYHDAYLEFKEREFDQLKELIYNQYPLPIAYYFRQTQYGYLDNNNRLQILRSTWEAIIFVLYGIVIGEARKKSFPLRLAGIRDNDLYSFSIDRKLNIIEKVLQYDKNNTIGLKCGILFDVNEIVKIKQLNYQRNGFQHLAPLSEEQAETLFAELFPEIIEALKSISQIQEIEIFHFINSDGNPFALRCETFIGNSPNRTINTYQISQDQMASTGVELNSANILAKIEDDIFSISPFIHFISDDGGHLTNLCYLHQINPDNINEFKFEIARRSTYIYIPIISFTDRMNELRILAT